MALTWNEMIKQVVTCSWLQAVCGLIHPRFAGVFDEISMLQQSRWLQRPRPRCRVRPSAEPSCQQSTLVSWAVCLRLSWLQLPNNFLVSWWAPQTSSQLPEESWTPHRTKQSNRNGCFFSSNLAEWPVEVVLGGSPHPFVSGGLECFQNPSTFSRTSLQHRLKSIHANAESNLFCLLSSQRASRSACCSSSKCYFSKKKHTSKILSPIFSLFSDFNNSRACIIAAKHTHRVLKDGEKYTVRMRFQIVCINTESWHGK